MEEGAGRFSGSGAESHSSCLQPWTPRFNIRFAVVKLAIAFSRSSRNSMPSSAAVLHRFARPIVRAIASLLLTSLLRQTPLQTAAYVVQGIKQTKYGEISQQLQEFGSIVSMCPALKDCWAAGNIHTITSGKISSHTVDSRRRDGFLTFGAGAENVLARVGYRLSKSALQPVN
jgi:hypothetical protein